jgi:hypothetical protein
MGHADSTRRFACATLRAAALAALATAGASTQAEGLVLRPQESPGISHMFSEYALTNYRMPSNSIRLFSDYYFFDPGQSTLVPPLGSLVSGFRASTGIVDVGQPLSLYGAGPESLQSLPYVGLGYSHLWFTGQLSLNADLGLASQSHGHGLFGGPSALDDVTSQLRWAPVMAVNMRYSF